MEHDYIGIFRVTVFQAMAISVKGLTVQVKFLKFWPIMIKQPIDCYFHYFVYFSCISDRNWFILLNLL